MAWIAPLVEAGGRIIQGVGAMKNAKAMGGVMQQQQQMQQNWYDLAATESAKASHWIENFGTSFGEDFMEDWTNAEEILQQWDKDGTMSENFQKQIDGRISGFKQSAGRDVRKGTDAISESLAMRGISKESGTAANALGEFETATRTQLAQYENQLEDRYKDKIIGDMRGLRAEAANSPLFELWEWDEEKGELVYNPSQEQREKDKREFIDPKLEEIMNRDSDLSDDEFFNKYKGEFDWYEVGMGPFDSRNKYRKRVLQILTGKERDRLSDIDAMAQDAGQPTADYYEDRGFTRAGEGIFSHTPPPDVNYLKEKYPKDTYSSMGVGNDLSGFGQSDEAWYPTALQSYYQDTYPDFDEKTIEDLVGQALQPNYLGS